MKKSIFFHDSVMAISNVDGRKTREMNRVLFRFIKTF